MVLGFSFDVYLAKRPDSLVDNVLILSYFSIAAVCIYLLNRRSVREVLGEQTPQPLFLLLIMQFCFGGLASNLLVLYGKSGSLGSSLLFIALLGGLLIGNEFLKNRYQQLRFNLAVFYIELLTYLVIAVPTFITHRIGALTFVLSGLLSLLVTALFLSILFPSVWKKKLPQPVWQLGSMVMIIFLIFSGFYAANIIPPVPLSLKSAGIYHSIEPLSVGSARMSTIAPNTVDAIYRVTYEPKQWYEFWRDTADEYHIATGEPAYCFSAVFAPGNLSTPIRHRWEYLYPQTNHWITTGLVEFPINGGRDEGYRGFSKKQVLEDGEWRCTVETSTGQIIGRITFTVKTSSTTQALSTTTL